MEVEDNQNDDMGLPAPCTSPPARTPTPSVTIAKYNQSCGPQGSPASIIPPMKRRLITLSTAGNLKISPLAPQQLQQRRPHPVGRSGAGGPTRASDVINLTHEAPEHDAQAVGPGPFSNAAASPAYGEPLEAQGPAVQQPSMTAAGSPDREPQVESDTLSSKQEGTPRRLFVLPMRPLQGGLLLSPSVAGATTFATAATAATATTATTLSAIAWAEDNTSDPGEKQLTSPPTLQQHSLRTRTLLAVAAAAAAVAAHDEEGAAEVLTTAELRDAALRNLQPAANGPSTPQRDCVLQETRRDEELQQLQQLQQAHQQPCNNQEDFVEDWPQDPQRPSLFGAGANEAALGHAGWDPQEMVCGVEGAVGGSGDGELGQADDGQGAVGGDMEMSRLTLTITIAVRASSNRGRRQLAEGGALVVCRKGYVKGPVCGVFDLVRYLGGRDCVLYQGRWISRSKFEKVGGSTMAKWYRSIRVMPTLEPLGEWLELHNLPVSRGPNRRSRKRSAEDSGDELGDPWQREMPVTGHRMSCTSEVSLRDGGDLSPAGFTAAAGAWGNQIPMLLDDGRLDAIAVAASGSDDSLPAGMLPTWPLPPTAATRPPVADESQDAAEPYRLYQMAAVCDARGTDFGLQSEARLAELESALTDVAGPAHRKRQFSASEVPALSGAVIEEPQQPQPQPCPLQLQPRPSSQPKLVTLAPLQPQNSEEDYVSPRHPADVDHQPAEAGPSPGPQRCRLSSTGADGAAAAWVPPHGQVVEVSDDDDDDDDDDVIVVEDIRVNVRERRDGGGQAASVAALGPPRRQEDLPELTYLRPRLPVEQALRQGDFHEGPGGGQDARANAEKQQLQRQEQQQQQLAVLQPIQQPQQLQEQHSGQHGWAARRPRLLLRKAVGAGDMSIDGTVAHTQPYFFTIPAPPDMLYCPPSNTGPAVVAAVAPDGVEEGTSLSELGQGDGSRHAAASETAAASGAVRRAQQPNMQRRQALSAISCENLTRGALLAAHSLQALQQHSEQPAAYSALGGHVVSPPGFDVLQRRNAGPCDSVPADLDANRPGWGGPKSLGRTALDGAAQASHRPVLQAPKQQLSRQPGSWRTP